ncbi:MAG: CHC2 zinc finger domain-containing protein [Chloroflexota bacterium]|nr:CHC2 zinc finger domain-containing protein [Chloroflexota bacterium]
MTTVDLQALKRRHPLGDVVEASGVQLHGRGRVRQGVCPFHEETEGSFTVYADSERWYCFGCGEGGDVLDYVRRVESLSLPEAIRRLSGGVWAITHPPPLARPCVRGR